MPAIATNPTATRIPVRMRFLDLDFDDRLISIFLNQVRVIDPESISEELLSPAVYSFPHWLFQGPCQTGSEVKTDVISHNYQLIRRFDRG
jgi:hypothetical protein